MRPTPFDAMAMTPEELRIARACKWKRAYDSYSEAEGNGVRVYRCQHCRKFHRTSIKKQKRAKIPAVI